MNYSYANSVYSAIFSPDGTKIVTASDDATAKIWRFIPQELLNKDTLLASKHPWQWVLLKHRFASYKNSHHKKKTRSFKDFMRSFDAKSPLKMHQFIESNPELVDCLRELLDGPLATK